jgi:hypothetical protein
VIVVSPCRGLEPLSLSTGASEREGSLRSPGSANVWPRLHPGPHAIEQAHERKRPQPRIPFRLMMWRARSTSQLPLWLSEHPGLRGYEHLFGENENGGRCRDRPLCMVVTDNQSGSLNWSSASRGCNGYAGEWRCQEAGDNDTGSSNCIVFHSVFPFGLGVSWSPKRTAREAPLTSVDGACISTQSHLYWEFNPGGVCSSQRRAVLAPLCTSRVVEHWPAVKAP